MTDPALDALDAALIADDEPDFDSEPAPAPDVHVATARLGRKARLLRERDEIVAAAEYRRAQIDAFVDRETGRIDRQVAWLDRSLNAYHAMLIAKDPKRLTLHLPTGDLVSRMGQPTWTVTDEKALLDWLSANRPECVRQKPAPEPEVDRNAIKQVLIRRLDRRTTIYGVDPETNEKVPGVEVDAPVRNYEARPTAPDADFDVPEAEIVEDEAS